MAVLSVPADSIWNKWPVSQRRVIYDRPCYAQLYQRCQTAWESGCALVVVKGTPGIGKSFFLDYVLSKLLLLASKSVMVILGPRGQVHLYKNGHSSAPEEITLTDATTHNRAREVDHVLYDPQENALQTQEMDISMFCGKNVLIAMSPDPGNCSKILKDATQEQQLYMGPTSFEEAEDMRAKCYASAVTADDLAKRFDQAGGVPRLLMKAKAPVPPTGFDDSILKHISDQQTFALNDLVVSPRRIDSGSVASQFKSLWGLYHLVPDDSYTNYQIELCCDNAVSLLREHLLEMDVQRLWSLYEGTGENMGMLRGIRFEAYAHKKILIHGVDDTAKKLNQNAVSSSVTKRIVIPPGAAKYRLRDNDVGQLATQRAQIHQNGGGYMLLYLPNYPVIDSAFVSATNSCFMLQMKAGRSKPLSDKVTTVTAALGNTFVVVVPNDLIATKKLAGSPATMDQFVLILAEETSI